MSASSPRALRVAALLAALLGLVTLAGGCFDSIVGAECADGRYECAGQCVDLRTDPHHCGGCGNACAGECRAAMCVGEPLVDAAVVDAAVVDASTSDGGGDASRSSDAGDGGVVDAMPAPDALFCDAPLTACGSVCVDTSQDPDHCGSCSQTCPSGLCQDSVCLGGQTGHVVVIGHDYRRGRVGMNRLVGNAVFLSSGLTVQVAAYVGDAATPNVNGTNAAIDQVASEIGRAWQRTTLATADAVPAALATADVFLVYAQTNASNADLQALGGQWSSALDSFVRAGGVVIVLDGGGNHDGTVQILDAAGLFAATGRTIVVGSTMDVVDPGDAVARGVPLSYFGEINSATIDTQEGNVVVRSGGLPVVIHRLVF